MGASIGTRPRRSFQGHAAIDTSGCPRPASSLRGSAGWPGTEPCADISMEASQPAGGATCSATAQRTDPARLTGTPPPNPREGDEGKRRVRNTYCRPALGLALLLGLALGAAVTQALQPEPAVAQLHAGTIVAREFVVVDEGGQSRAIFRAQPDGSAGLWIMDPEGRHRAGLALASQGYPSLGLWDQDGLEALQVTLQDDSPMLVLKGASGETRLAAWVDAEEIPYLLLGSELLR